MQISAKTFLEGRSGLPPTPLPPDIVKSLVGEIKAVCKKELGKSPREIDVLDVGSGHGEYSFEMSKHFKSVTGIEPQKSAYQFALNNYDQKDSNLKYINTSIEKFKSKKKYDLVVTLTVIEHMKNAKSAYKNVVSLLKNNGIIYLTAPNKYWIFEQHYGLPFLSWLPLPLANRYLRTVLDVSSYEDSSHSLGYRGMKRFFDELDCRYKFILPTDIKSAYIGCGNKAPLPTLIKNLGIKLIGLHPFFWNFSKGFIMVIRRK